MSQEQLPQPEHQSSTPEVNPLKQACDLKHFIYAAQDEFLQGAIAMGVPDEDLNRLAADAMTAGEIPRIIVALSMRTGSTTYILLDGIIPSDAIKVKILRSPNAPEYIRASIEMNHELAPKEDGTYSVKRVAVPGFNSGEGARTISFDESILDELKAHIALPTSETNYNELLRRYYR